MKLTLDDALRNLEILYRCESESSQLRQTYQIAIDAIKEKKEREEKK